MTFAAIRDIPQQGLSEWEAATLNAMKENIEILAGVRRAGERAVMNTTITINTLGIQQLVQVSATDNTSLGIDIQLLANDVIETRNTLNNLIQQLKS
jgi:hypothetical protein